MKTVVSGQLAQLGHDNSHITSQINEPPTQPLTHSPTFSLQKCSLHTPDISRWVSCSAAKRCRPPMNDAQTLRGSFQLLLCACHILASSRINQQADILKGAAAATHPPHLFLTG